MTRASIDLPWRPLLRADTSALAESTVLELAESVRARAVVRPGLGSGAAGEAVFLAHVARRWPERFPASAAIERLDAAVQAAATSGDLEFSYGWSGIAWACDRVLELAGPPPPEDPCEDVDERLVEVLEGGPWRGDYDLLGGLVGFGVYALGRRRGTRSDRIVSLVVTRLLELAEAGPAGSTWFTPPDRLPPQERSLAPDGYYNLGVAHGVPGVVAFLARAAALGEARRGLEDAVDWLMRIRPERAGGYAFPHWVGPTGAQGGRCRIGWCYGDLGVALALAVAGRTSSDPRLEAEALRIAGLVADRDPEDSGAVDACLCHGTAGIAHLFNRLFQATGEERFGAVAQAYFRRTLEGRRPGEGVGGYRSWSSEGWIDDSSFLGGAAGVGLALLSAVSDEEPVWDQALLADVPLRRSPSRIGATA